MYYLSKYRSSKYRSSEDRFLGRLYLDCSITESALNRKGRCIRSGYSTAAYGTVNKLRKTFQM